MVDVKGRKKRERKLGIRLVIIMARMEMMRFWGESFRLAEYSEIRMEGRGRGINIILSRLECIDDVGSKSDDRSLVAQLWKRIRIDGRDKMGALCGHGDHASGPTLRSLSMRGKDDQHHWICGCIRSCLAT